MNRPKLKEISGLRISEGVYMAVDPNSPQVKAAVERLEGVMNTFGIDAGPKDGAIDQKFIDAFRQQVTALQELVKDDYSSGRPGVYTPDLGAAVVERVQSDVSILELLSEQKQKETLSDKPVPQAFKDNPKLLVQFANELPQIVEAANLLAQANLLNNPPPFQPASAAAQPASAPPAQPSPQPAAAQTVTPQSASPVFPAEAVTRLRSWMEKVTGDRPPGVPFIGSRIDNSPTVLKEILEETVQGLRARLQASENTDTVENLSAAIMADGRLQRVVEAQLPAGIENTEQLLNDIKALDNYINNPDVAVVRLKEALAKYGVDPGSRDAVPDQEFLNAVESHIIDLQKMTNAEITAEYSFKLGEEAADRARSILSDAKAGAGRLTGMSGGYVTYDVDEFLVDSDNPGWMEWLYPDQDIPDKLVKDTALFEEFARDLPMIVHDIELLEGRGLLTQAAQRNPAQTVTGQPGPAQPSQPVQPGPSAPQPAPATDALQEEPPEMTVDQAKSAIQIALRKFYNNDTVTFDPDKAESQNLLHNAIMNVKLGLSFQGVYDGEIDGTYDPETGQKIRDALRALKERNPQEYQEFLRKVGDEENFNILIGAMNALHKGNKLNNEAGAKVKPAGEIKLLMWFLDTFPGVKDFLRGFLAQYPAITSFIEDFLGWPISQILNDGSAKARETPVQRVDYEQMYNDALTKTNGGDPEAVKAEIHGILDQLYGKVGLVMSQEQKDEMKDIVSNAIDKAAQATPEDAAKVFASAMDEGIKQSRVDLEMDKVEAAVASPQNAPQSPPAGAAPRSRLDIPDAEFYRRNFYAQRSEAQNQYFRNHHVAGEDLAALFSAGGNHPDLEKIYRDCLDLKNVNFKDGTIMLHQLEDGRMLASRGYKYQTADGPAYHLEHALVDLQTQEDADRFFAAIGPLKETVHTVLQNDVWRVAPTLFVTVPEIAQMVQAGDAAGANRLYRSVTEQQQLSGANNQYFDPRTGGVYRGGHQPVNPGSMPYNPDVDLHRALHANAIGRDMMREQHRRDQAEGIFMPLIRPNINRALPDELRNSSLAHGVGELIINGGFSTLSRFFNISGQQYNPAIYGEPHGSPHVSRFNGLAQGSTNAYPYQSQTHHDYRQDVALITGNNGPPLAVRSLLGAGRLQGERAIHEAFGNSDGGRVAADVTTDAFRWFLNRSTGGMTPP